MKNEIRMNLFSGLILTIAFITCYVYDAFWRIETEKIRSEIGQQIVINNKMSFEWMCMKELWREDRRLHHVGK